MTVIDGRNTPRGVISLSGDQVAGHDADGNVGVDPGLDPGARAMLARWARLVGEPAEFTGALEATVIVEWAQAQLDAAFAAEGEMCPRGGIELDVNVALTSSSKEFSAAFLAAEASRVTVWWEGTFTKGRWVEVVLDFAHGPRGNHRRPVVAVSLRWDSGTGEPSQFLDMGGFAAQLEDAGRLPSWAGDLD